MIQGSCLCGSVRYRYDGMAETLSMCHCRRCQKAQGTAFVAVVPMATEAFTLMAEAQTLGRYESSPGKIRVFCRNCGSPLWSERSDRPDVKRVRAGTIDDPIAPVTRFHAFVSEKAEWLPLGDGLPQYREWPESL
ncbi:GFA family protein [Algiphilus sp. NNCM1]|uniref:GFA family protein n=1 Tax=Algiphilus sp. TaxID=1872431 RepID=UPI001CA646F3|nr:GFA family protein [Algiphilus sp.]MBY8965325.1 GFA family protein [Algiphilus acroporae]MCI5103933.1 GFA family protein [Algiphilus sp.]